MWGSLENAVLHKKSTTRLIAETKGPKMNFSKVQLKLWKWRHHQNGGPTFPHKRSCDSYLFQSKLCRFQLRMDKCSKRAFDDYRTKWCQNWGATRSTHFNDHAYKRSEKPCNCFSVWRSRGRKDTRTTNHGNEQSRKRGITRAKNHASKESREQRITRAKNHASTRNKAHK